MKANAVHQICPQKVAFASNDLLDKGVCVCELNGLNEFHVSISAAIYYLVKS